MDNLENGMKDLQFEHIGITVNNIEESLASLKRHFKTEAVSEVYRDNLQNVAILFLNASGIKIELIAPLDRNKKSPIDNLLKKNVAYYHLCFRTSCFEENIADLIKNGAMEIVKPIPAVAFGNKKITFLFLGGLGLIEVVEKHD